MSQEKLVCNLFENRNNWFQKVKDFCQSLIAYVISVYKKMWAIRMIYVELVRIYHYKSFGGIDGPDEL